MTSKSGRRLRMRVSCPSCWHRFAPHEAMSIAVHDSLRHDPVVGPDAFLRFLPSRFTEEGNAIDPAGSEARELACPRCHLAFCRALLEFDPISISVVGAPGAGKSFLLAAMTWSLRQTLPRMGWTFQDALPEANAPLAHNESQLFMTAGDQPVTLEKTQTHGTDLYRSVSIRGASVRLPVAFQFALTRNAQRRGLRGRVLVLYDNAGEHFLPGGHDGRAPVTDHLSRADTTLFLFDPTQDMRVRRELKTDDPQLSSGYGSGGTLARQEIVLAEAIERTRAASGLGPAERHDKPLIVVLAKADLWVGLLGAEPREPFSKDEATGLLTLDFKSVKSVSANCRQLMEQFCPDIVQMAEGFAKHVLFLPASATGSSPSTIRRGGTSLLAFRPSDLRPWWSSVPVLCALSHEPHKGPNTTATSGDLRSRP